MTRYVTGKDGVVRPAVPEAPDWRPGTRSMAKEYRAEARRLDGEAGSRMRAEAQIAGKLAGYTPPTMEQSGALPYGPARGPLEWAEFEELDGGAVAASRDRPRLRARRRRGPTALSALPAALKAAAGRYAALVEAVGAPRAPDMDAPRAGGVSDGGATARCGLACQLDAAIAAIGGAAVLHPRGALAHADRGRVVVTVRDLVDRVCVDGWTLEQLLQRRGWSRWGVHTRALRDALTEALERLQHVV